MGKNRVEPDDELMGIFIAYKLQKKADELGIRFKVKYKYNSGLQDVLLRIQTPELKADANSEEMRERLDYNYRKQQFIDFAETVILGKYANSIRFSHPKKL